MSKAIEAVYENGILRPVQKDLGLDEGAPARLLICVENARTRRRALRGTLTRAECERQIGVVDHEFGRAEGEWSASRQHQRG